MKPSQSSVELAMVSLKKDRQGRGGILPGSVPVQHKGLQLSAKGLAVTEWAQK